MDFSRLTGEEFELLCARLLQASGYTIQRQEARSRDVGKMGTHTIFLELSRRSTEPGLWR
jgi:hypothetical protein